MNGGLAIMLWAMASAPSDAEPSTACAEEAGAAERADRLSELPPEIRDDLKMLTKAEMADRDAPLLRTDAPAPSESGNATVRFARALRFRDTWLVQFETAL